MENVHSMVRELCAIGDLEMVRRIEEEGQAAPGYGKVLSVIGDTLWVLDISHGRSASTANASRQAEVAGDIGESGATRRGFRSERENDSDLKAKGIPD